MFRKDNAAHGRWMSPDPAGLAAVNPSAPQTWNRYAYVGNSPLNATDPLGLYGNVPDCNPYYYYCAPPPACGVDDPYCNGCDPYDPYCPGNPGGGGGGGGGGGAPVGNPPAPPQRKGGVWPDNETLGLLRGLNLHPATLADLLGLS